MPGDRLPPHPGIRIRRLGNRHSPPARTLVRYRPQRNPAGRALQPPVRVACPTCPGMGRVLRRCAAGRTLHPIDRTDSHVDMSAEVISLSNPELAYTTF